MMCIFILNSNKFPMNREQVLDVFFILKTPFVDNIYQVTETEPMKYLVFMVNKRI